MVKKIVKKFSLDNKFIARQDIEYWLSRPPSERVAAVDFLRKQYYGKTERLQRVARVVKQT